MLKYIYDNAGRLTDIEDKAGNKTHYTLDTLGHRTKEEVFDPSGTLKRVQSQVFTSLGQLHQIKNAANQVVTEYGYDDNGARTSQTDAGSFTTIFALDTLKRTEQITDAANGITINSYNALDQLVSVTDPKGLITSYAYNALGDLKTLVSPDTGTTNYTYDAAGNRKSQTDARGVTANYSYDKLNRLTSIDYPGTVEDVSYTYDGANYSASVPYGKGRLTGISDESGTTTLHYDARGNVIEEHRAIDGTVYTTAYSYSAADKLATITYPSGRVVTYVRDNSNDPGRITKVTTTYSGATTTVAQFIDYMPFGSIRSYELGNGVAVTRSYDLDYSLASLKDHGTATIQDRTLAYDLRGNIEEIVDGVDGARTQTFAYDSLSRLTSASGAYGYQSFTYDGVGNRLTAASGTSTLAYSYPATSHRLSSISDGTTLIYDAMGSITGKGGLTLTYNSAGRLSSASGSGALTATYNSAGQRVKKTSDGVVTVFHYDRGGHLIAEDEIGSPLQREYIWLEGNPLLLDATVKRTEVIVDNSDRGFSVTGTWSSVGVGTGIYGEDFLWHGPGGEPPGTMLLDDLTSGSSITGMWYARSEPPNADCFGVPCIPRFWYNDSYEGSTFFDTDDLNASMSMSCQDIPCDPLNIVSPRKFTWGTTASPGDYRIYANWPWKGGSITLDLFGGDYGLAQYDVSDSIGQSSQLVEQGSGGRWHLLETRNLDGEVTISVTDMAGPEEFVVADAMRLIPNDDNLFDQARWLPPEKATYEVFARWPSSVWSEATKQAVYVITHSDGRSELIRDQRNGGAIWNALGTFNLDSANGRVALLADPDYGVYADAVRFVPAGASVYKRVSAYFHVDHLGTPQKMTNQDQDVVWSASYEPFGTASVTAERDHDNPLRMPGQYFDAETGLHQNWWRDYDPSLGRYLESDPIGLKGGLSSYGYVNQSPTNGIDPKGLVRVYGDWCGPDWTGGHMNEWNNLSAEERHNAEIIPPSGPIDAACMKHDKCYASCRGNYPCSPDGRSACFMDCDLDLYGDVYSRGFWGYVIGSAMGRGGKRDPGPNAPSCSGCE